VEGAALLEIFCLHVCTGFVLDRFCRGIKIFSGDALAAIADYGADGFPTLGTCSEFSFGQELDKNPEGKLFTCMDMKGTKLSMFAGEVKVRTS